jgi:hypothetical protein
MDQGMLVTAQTELQILAVAVVAAAVLQGLVELAVQV